MRATARSLIIPWSQTVICTVLLHCYNVARHSANSGSSDAAETDTVATDSTVSLVAAAAAEEGSSSSTNATSSSSSSSSCSLAGGAHSAAHTKSSGSQVQHHMAVIGEDTVRRPSSAGVTVTDFSVKAHAKVSHVLRNVLRNGLRNGPENSSLLHCLQKYAAAVCSVGCGMSNAHGGAIAVAVTWKL
jgi:hypothetical protein